MHRCRPNIRVHIQTYVHTHIYTSRHIYMYIYVRMYIRTYTHIYVYICTYIYIYICVYGYIKTHACLRRSRACCCAATHTSVAIMLSSAVLKSLSVFSSRPVTRCCTYEALSC